MGKGQQFRIKIAQGCPRPKGSQSGRQSRTPTNARWPYYPWTAYRKGCTVYRRLVSRRCNPVVNRNQSGEFVIWYRLSVHYSLFSLQLIQALTHAAFKNMIDIAARATCGVKIPGRKATRAHIISLFKQNLMNLRDRFKVSVLIFNSINSFS